MAAISLGQVAAGDDAELGGERLEQHGDQIRRQHHPQQLVAVTRAGLDVGGEISRIDIGDRGDHRRTHEGEPPGHPAAPAGQHLAGDQDRPLGQRHPSCRLWRFPLRHRPDHRHTAPTPTCSLGYIKR
jgi:hypothetical protein